MRFRRAFKLKWLAGAVGLLLCAMIACQSKVPAASPVWGQDQVRVHPTRWIPSAYFDDGMKYSGSRFEVVSLTRLLESMHPKDADALVLDCYDDYEGLLTVSDIRQYDLQLAVGMKLAAGADRPDWLKPMVVIVPDGVIAPKVERFMTANIRALRWVKRSDYYAPITQRLNDDASVQRGFHFFADNCLFCHGLEGVGGNKGTALLAAFRFSGVEGRLRFEKEFINIHNPTNEDHQDMEQYLGHRSLESVADFLGRLQGR